VRIALVGRGRLGGGLGDLWQRAGHEVTRIGRDGGSVADAEAVLIAVPGGAVEDALEALDGLAGKTAIDATNLARTSPPGGFASNAEFIKSRTGGPTAKAFNLNFASLFDRLAHARALPGNIWCGDEEARGAVERLSRDAGYEPLYAGPLANAAIQEGAIALLFAVSRGGLGQFVYRMAAPEQL
jgi:8-hydroxy-5-deazaflavin:NADPH oxidoreductase